MRSWKETYDDLVTAIASVLGDSRCESRTARERALVFFDVLQSRGWSPEETIGALRNSDRGRAHRVGVRITRIAFGLSSGDGEGQILGEKIPELTKEEKALWDEFYRDHRE